MVSIPEFTYSHIPGALDWYFPPRVLLSPTDNREHAELEARADRIVALYKLPPAFGANFIGATRRIWRTMQNGDDQDEYVIGLFPPDSKFIVNVGGKKHIYPLHKFVQRWTCSCASLPSVAPVDRTFRSMSLNEGKALYEYLYTGDSTLVLGALLDVTGIPESAMTNPIAFGRRWSTLINFMMETMSPEKLELTGCKIMVFAEQISFMSIRDDKLWDTVNLAWYLLRCAYPAGRYRTPDDWRDRSNAAWSQAHELYGKSYDAKMCSMSSMEFGRRFDLHTMYNARM
ncbi:uncharacterized protein ARMOST_14595 [Armillaria ostoyae]|uniref:Uncharacterized protein n=1 Tax=Armillaria ostoyae TaxID=47428 RepID=A0A284RQZ1_ARMOS|nr:uncharacterized protein ARMOST_14595 [Armillaria ostoyae]